MLNVGIIGYGRIGSEHAGWIADSGAARVAAVADQTPARRALAEERGLNAVATDDELLNDENIDAVLIAVPTAMHFDVAMRAIVSGKHVMVEKPMAIDLSQSEHMHAEAKRRNRVLSVFHNRRWDLDYLSVRKAIQSGVFGKLINIESRLGQFASCVGPAAKEYRPNWRNEAEFGGGGLYDWGSHFVDQVWRLMLPAKPVRVFAQMRANVWSAECDDFTRVAIDFSDGTAAMVEINTTTTRPLPRWHIDGTKGSASSEPSADFDTRVWAGLVFTPAPTEGQEDEPQALPIADGEGLTEPMIWRQFADAVAGKGEPAVTAESVLITMRLLDAARDSARKGQAVSVE